VQAQVEKLLAQPLPHFWNLLAHAALVRALLCQGKAEAAEAVARRAVEALGPMKMCGVGARALLCQALLAQGKVAAAVAAAEEGLELLRDVGGTCLFDVRLLRAAAEAYQAAGDGEAGRAHLDEARRLIGARAADIPDPTQRERFLKVSRSS
jgi:ATP/maltotriose-dependent transcriptional regulator MalT